MKLLYRHLGGLSTVDAGRENDRDQASEDDM
jgi:hypothetical protein